MKYVILRDDDANGTTPVARLEPLYRPFLDRGLPVHLATIPCVRTDVHRRDGHLERYLCGEAAGRASYVPIENNRALLDYVQHEHGYVPVMHGFTHEFIHGQSEFCQDERAEIGQRLDWGLALFNAAGLGRPNVFVAPQDQLTRSSIREIMKRYRVLSTQYVNFEILPRRYWPAYLTARMLGTDMHVRLGPRTVLTHPGCILSNTKPLRGMLARVMQTICSHDVTVIVSHHWEYFHPDGSMNEPFVGVLHALADYLAKTRDIRVIRLDEGRLPNTGPRRPAVESND